MKKINIKTPVMLSALALGLSMPAFSQTAPAAQAVDPGPGLLGNNYSEVSFGYQRDEDAPKSLRDYEFVSNGSILKQDNYGLDGNFTYDHLSAASSGFSDRRDELELGLTGFLQQTWGKPFVSVDGGFAWQQAGGVSRKSWAYTTAAGVQFQVLKDLALSPFIEYQSEPHLYNRGLPLTDLPDHETYYGVKATYRITQQWSASLSADLDQHSARDFGLRGGVSYRF
jgi:hypothetical protein